MDDEPRDIALLKEFRVDSRKGSINIPLRRSESIKTFLGRTEPHSDWARHIRESLFALRAQADRDVRAPMTRSDLALCVFARL